MVGDGEWTLETFRAAIISKGGPDAITVLEDGLAWRARWGGWYEFGHGPEAPMYFVVPNRVGKGVKAILINPAGDLGVMYRYLEKHPPFNERHMRRDLTLHLNEIDGVKIPIERSYGKLYHVKLAVLRVPEKRAAFFAVFDDVAHFLRGPSAWGRGRNRRGPTELAGTDQ